MNIMWRGGPETAYEKPYLFEVHPASAVAEYFASAAHWTAQRRIYGAGGGVRPDSAGDWQIGGLLPRHWNPSEREFRGIQ